MKNLGKELVAYSIDLNVRWMKVHKYLYSKGQEIIPDSLYDKKYQPIELELGLPGAPLDHPPIPSHAKLKEEAEAYDLPLWDHMAEFRTRREVSKV